jgi:transposase
MLGKSDKKFQTESKYNRYFSEEFKRSKVKDLLSKKVRIKELCVLYSLSRATIYKWIYLYSDTEKGTKTVVQMESEYVKTQELLTRLAELERVVGQKQMEIDYLNKAFDLANEEVGYDLKKKYASGYLNGSESTKRATPTK